MCRFSIAWPARRREELTLRNSPCALAHGHAGISLVWNGNKDRVRAMGETFRIESEFQLRQTSEVCLQLRHACSRSPQCTPKHESTKGVKTTPMLPQQSRSGPAGLWSGRCCIPDTCNPRASPSRPVRHRRATRTCKLRR